MAQREQDDLPYRSPVTPVAKGAKVWGKDEENQDTLRMVLREFEKGMDGLYKNFNTFEITKDKSSKEAADILMRQILAKQEAFDILMPLFEAVKSAIERVDNKFKQR